MIKQCSKCKESKPINEFPKEKKGKNGFSAQCKMCHLERTRLYWKKKPWSQTLSNIKSRCYYSTHYLYKRKGIKNYLTLNDLEFLWYRDGAYLLKQPSIDRKDSNGHYALDNCRFIELFENRGRNVRGRKVTEKQRLAARNNLRNFYIRNKMAKLMREMCE